MLINMLIHMYSGPACAPAACCVRARALDKRLTVDAELIAERLLAFRAYRTYLLRAFRCVPVRTILFNQIGRLTCGSAIELRLYDAFLFFL